MYTLKKLNGAEVLHNNNEPATCPYAMAAVPFQSALGQMQVVPINRECSSRCALFDRYDNNVKLHCSNREIRLNYEKKEIFQTL